MCAAGAQTCHASPCSHKAAQSGIDHCKISTTRKCASARKAAQEHKVRHHPASDCQLWLISFVSGAICSSQIIKGDNWSAKLTCLLPSRFGMVDMHQRASLMTHCSSMISSANQQQRGQCCIRSTSLVHMLMACNTHASGWDIVTSQLSCQRGQCPSSGLWNGQQLRSRRLSDPPELP